MRQKRQHFQKRIRRQQIQKIFKANRQKYFNYTFNNNHLPTQIANQIKDQCIEQFTRYITEIEQALKEEQQSSLCTSVKESALFLKRILIKAKESADCITFIVQNWYKLGFDQRLFESVNMFIPFTQHQFSGVRKQTYGFALQHFSLIFQYEGIVQRIKGYEEKLFSFLFLIIAQLGNEPESILEIMYLLNVILIPSAKVRHDFFFNNRFKNNQSTTMKICFEHLISAIFQNKEKMSMPNSKNQTQNYNQLKMFFLDFFTMLCSQLKSLQKYIDNCKQVGANMIIPESQKLANDVYENILRLAGFPEQVELKTFLDKSQIAIIHGVIIQMKEASYQNVSQSRENAQNLATCLQAFRGLIQFYPKKKIIMDFQNELQFLLQKLSSNEYSIIVKHEIIMLIDTIIFLDTNNEMTDYLIRHHNLFQKVWSHQDKNVFNVKLNILNNIILSDAGFDIAMRFSSQILITLRETRYVGLAQTFCINYFAKTEYCLSPSSKLNIVIEILYSLPMEHFGVQQLQKDYYIFSLLYEHGFSQKLPKRYQNWDKSDYTLNLDKISGQNHTNVQQKTILFDRILALQTTYTEEGFMEE